MNIRRYTTLVLVQLVVGCGMASAQIQWNKISDFSGEIALLAFQDELHGFACLGSGPGGLHQPEQVLRTTDGGKTWKVCMVDNSPTFGGYGIFDLIMLDQRNGFACGGSADGGSLWRTTDGGVSWNRTGPENVQLSSTVRMTGAGLLLTDFFEGTVRLSTDSGKTFIDVFASPRNDAVLGMDFCDDLHGTLTGSWRAGNPWYYTEDGGRTWTPSNAGIESWTVCAIKGSSELYAAPEGFSNTNPTPSMCYRSSDKGLSWQVTSQLPVQTCGSMHQAGGVLYAQSDNSVGGRPGLYSSRDKGKTWLWLGGPDGYGDTRFSVVSTSCDRRIIYVAGKDFGLYRGIDTLSGGSYSVEVTAFTLSQPTAERAPNDTAGVEIEVLLSASNPLVGLVPQMVTLTLEHNPNVTMLARFGDIIPAPGWALQNINLGGSNITLTLANPGKVPIGRNQDFGKIIFTVNPTPTGVTSIVRLTSMTATTDCKEFIVTPDIESGQFRTISAQMSSVSDRPAAAAALSVTPNPAGNSLVVRYPGLANAMSTIELVDVTGRTVMQRSLRPDGSGERVLDCSTLASGRYILVVRSDRLMSIPVVIEH